MKKQAGIQPVLLSLCFLIFLSVLAPDFVTGSQSDYDRSDNNSIDNHTGIFQVLHRIPSLPWNKYALGVVGIGFLLIILLLVHDHNALDKQEHPEVHDNISNTNHLCAGVGLGERDDITEQ